MGKSMITHKWSYPIIDHNNTEVPKTSQNLAHTVIEQGIHNRKLKKGQN